jgi:hypothetical protein
VGGEVERDRVTAAVGAAVDVALDLALRAGDIRHLDGLGAREPGPGAFPGPSAVVQGPRRLRVAPLGLGRRSRTAA